ncbi:MAG: IS3 family transposase [Hydrogenoanaerobacterium sp.]
MDKRYTTDQKQKLIELYQNGQSVSNLSSEFAVPPSTIYTWIHSLAEVKRPSGETCTPTQIYLLEKHIKKLEMKLAIWEQSECAINSPLPQKLEAIMKLHEKYGVHAACETLGVMRSTFYHYQRRRPEKTQIQQEDEILKPAILQVFEDCKGRIGSKKIRVKLRVQGFTVSPERIVRLMSEMNLICVTAPNAPRPVDVPSRPYRNNRLRQQFTQTQPNKVWVSDITLLKAGDLCFYLCTIIDLFSRKVIAYELSDGCEVDLVITTFRLAYDNRKPDEDLLFHSDQGAQYTAYKFRKLLRNHKIKQSFSKPGCPYDNAVAESFFRTIKAEETSRHFYRTKEELRASIEEYIQFFNNDRPHQRLGYKTPNQVEAAYFMA